MNLQHVPCLGALLCLERLRAGGVALRRRSRQPALAVRCMGYGWCCGRSACRLLRRGGTGMLTPLQSRFGARPCAAAEAERTRTPCHKPACLLATATTASSGAPR